LTYTHDPFGCVFIPVGSKSPSLHFTQSYSIFIGEKIRFFPEREEHSGKVSGRGNLGCGRVSRSTSLLDGEDFPE
jgi:hypothetical protein